MMESITITVGVRDNVKFTRPNRATLNRTRTIINPDRVAATYRRAIADEQTVLALWPNAREYKKKNVAALGFSPVAEKAVEDFLKKHPDAARDPEATVNWYRAAHQKVIAKEMPKLMRYRPSELILANLQEAWKPFAELLLTAAVRLDGADFAALKPQLKDLGFAKEMLKFFRPSQRRKYFLQQTPAAIATFIVSQRLPEKVRSEETVRRAGKRLYSRIRSRMKTK